MSKTRSRSPSSPAIPGSAQERCNAGTSCTVRDPARFTDRQRGAHFHRDDCHGVDLQAIRDGTYHRPGEHGVDPWLDTVVDAHGPEIADLADAGRTVSGDGLLHNDLRPDNMLVDRDAMAYLLDWNWVCLGPAWVDFLGLLPQANRQGIDVRSWLQGPLFVLADDHTIDTVLAAIAVKSLGGQSEAVSPGLPDTIWAHKVIYSHDAVQLLATRRGWSPPC